MSDSADNTPLYYCDFCQLPQYSGAPFSPPRTTARLCARCKGRYYFPDARRKRPEPTPIIHSGLLPPLERRREGSR